MHVITGLTAGNFQFGGRGKPILAGFSANGWGWNSGFRLPASGFRLPASGFAWFSGFRTGQGVGKSAAAPDVTMVSGGAPETTRGGACAPLSVVGGGRLPAGDSSFLRAGPCFRTKIFLKEGGEGAAGCFVGGFVPEPDFDHALTRIATPFQDSPESLAPGQ